MRTRTRRRLLLLIVLALVLVGLGAYLYREHQLDESARVARTQGLEAYEAGDYGEAIGQLGTFIRRLDPDSLALLRYAQAIFRLPNPDAKHIGSAVDQLRRCIGMDPANAEARRELLGVYQRQGMRSEALLQAEWFLERQPDDAEALLVKAATLAEMQRFEEALQVLAPYVPAASPRLAAQLLYLRLMSSLGRTPGQIRTRARLVREAQSADARVAIVDAQASLLVGDLAEARTSLQALVEVAAGDKSFAQLLVPLLDAAGLPEEALRVMRGFEVSDLDVGLQTELARRLWEAGDAKALDQHIADWRRPAADLPTPVLGYWAMARARLQLTSGARELAEILRGRVEDDAAQGWAHLLVGVVLARDATSAERIAGCLRALDADGANAQARYELGVAYQAAGEVELALRELAAAAALSRTWAAPLTLGARMLAQDGRLARAIQAALGAEARASRDPGVAFLAAMMQGPGTTPGAAARERVLARLQEASASPRDVLPVQLSLAASSRDVEEARRLIDAALTADPPAEGEVLLACALLSRGMNLGLEARCEARYEQAYGLTPALALARARHEAEATSRSAGAAIFRAMRKQAPDASSPAWAAAEAVYLESQGLLEDALRAWREVAEGARGDPVLLRALLGAVAPWSDRALVHGAIEQLKSATTEAGLGWRFFRARYLLDDAAPDESAVSSALEYLRQVLDVDPDEVRARLLLATTYERRGDAKRALEQFMVARTRVRSAAVIDLRIARLQVQLGDWAAARVVLGRLVSQVQAGSDTLSPAAQTALAALLSRVGEKRQALALLDADSEAAFDPRAMQGRAELYAAAGELGQAERMVRPLIEAQDNVRSLLLAAALAEFRGDRTTADEYLERAAALETDPAAGDRLRADHYRRVDRFPDAERILQRLVAGDAATSQDWRSLLACQLQLGKGEDAARNLTRALSAGALASAGIGVELDPDLLRAAADQVALRPLGSTYLLDSDYRAVAGQALRLLASSDRDGLPAGDMDQLQVLAKRSPGCLPLQMVVADLQVRQRDFAGALATCRAASTISPLSPEPMRAMAYCFRAMQRHDEARQAALDWRVRVRTLPLEPDVFLAQQSGAAEAVELLEPYVALAAQRGLREVLLLHGEALILTNRAEEVETGLRPHAELGTTSREVWVQLASVAARHGQAALARRWLAADAALPAASVTTELRIQRAVAWQAVADVADDASARQNSRTLINEVPDSAGLGPADWERVGQVREGNGDRDLAEQAYREALRGSPRPLVATNNLALLLAATGRAQEALPLAEHAVTQRGDVAAYRDTLATVHMALGNAEAALAEHELCHRLEPAEPTWALHIVQTLVSLDRREAARKRLTVFEAQLGIKNLPAAQQAPWKALADALGE